ncbi:uncharacterized protein NPIL_332781 [Nephila pilipes]|uniref:Uncharacterized protein n=2 Tax=Nephila pilipes TaxID=299642 RepID=A0A8X6NU44_NEPPI|nr:uncharacterized protein NPIL_332781 [Nephila pilipes]
MLNSKKWLKEYLDSDIDQEVGVPLHRNLSPPFALKVPRKCFVAIIYIRLPEYTFLVDSGAAVRCFHRNFVNSFKKQDSANGSAIPTYGTLRLELDFGLRRSFILTFLVADVSHPILGVDFLERFELLIDVKNR